MTTRRDMLEGLHDLTPGPWRSGVFPPGRGEENGQYEVTAAGGYGFNGPHYLSLSGMCRAVDAEAMARAPEMIAEIRALRDTVDTLKAEAAARAREAAAEAEREKERKFAAAERARLAALAENAPRMLRVLAALVDELPCHAIARHHDVAPLLSEAREVVDLVRGATPDEAQLALEEG